MALRSTVASMTGTDARDQLVHAEVELRQQESILEEAAMRQQSRERHFEQVLTEVRDQHQAAKATLSAQYQAEVQSVELARQSLLQEYTENVEAKRALTTQNSAEMENVEFARQSLLREYTETCDARRTLSEQYTVELQSVAAMQSRLHGEQERNFQDQWHLEEANVGLRQRLLTAEANLHQEALSERTTLQATASKEIHEARRQHLNHQEEIQAAKLQAMSGQGEA